MRFDVILFVVGYMSCLWSICSFCEKFLDNFQINKIVFVGIMALAGVIFNGVDAWMRVPYIVKMMLSHLLFLGLIFLAFRDDFAKKIFVAAILTAIKTFVWNFGCSFFSCMYLIGADIATNGRLRNIDLRMENVIGAIAFGMVTLILNVWKKRFVTVFPNKSWYVVLTIPLLFIVAIADVVNWGASNGIMVVSNANGAAYWDVFYNQIISHAAMCLLMLLSMCIACGLVFGMNKICMEQRQKEQYHSQIAFYRMQSEQYTQMERLRHDMKNHVLSLHGLWEGNEFDKIGKYLEKMLESGKIGTNEEVTGNGAVDALLYNKRKQARQNRIRFMCDVQIPKNCVIDEFDLCVLFGNVFDNALSACMEMEDENDRFVWVHAGKVKNCFLFVVKNGTAMRDIKEMKPGVGFLNIHDTVKKYHGVINTKVEDRVFEISILMPLNSDGHNRKQTV